MSEQPRNGDAPQDKRAFNVLTSKEHFALCQWMVEHKERIAQIDSPQAAAEAAVALGFDVTRSNLLGATKATGVHTRQQITRAANATKVRAKPSGLEDRVAALELAVKSLTMAANGILFRS